MIHQVLTTAAFCNTFTLFFFRFEISFCFVFHFVFAVVDGGDFFLLVIIRIILVVFSLILYVVEYLIAHLI